MAKKKATKKSRSGSAKATAKTTRSVKKSKRATAPAKKHAAKSKAPAKKKGSARALNCNWTVTHFTAICAVDPSSPTFEYTRTNPQDATVQIKYSSSVNGPLDNTVSDVANWDDGHADCSGHPVRPWTTQDVILVGSKVRLELLLGATVKAFAETTVQQ